MRALTWILIGACACTAACNRAHLYKKAGIATSNAFANQAAPNNAPPPRPLDGEEAASIIAAMKAREAGAGDNAPTPSSGKPTALTLQSK